MSNLGFTFYPKDWWTSDTFYELEPFERYIYLECIFLMYVNDGMILNNKSIVERRLSCQIQDKIWGAVTSKMIETKEGNLTHVSVNSRLKKAKANRENGKNGGRPKASFSTEKNPKNPTIKPTEKPTENPSYKREREIEIKREREDEIKEGFSSPPTDAHEQFRDRMFPRSGYQSQTTSQSLAIKANEENAEEAMADETVLLWMSQQGLKTPELRQKAMSEFVTQRNMDGKASNSSDFRSHFRNWLKKAIPSLLQPKKEEVVNKFKNLRAYGS